ncbi:hypothetical protein, partial [Aphanothece microscopica]|uniref:hypothetical protein n=1 Tax=Aphanothece microscopica TaxID=1049561 RepID=UPI003985016B
MMLSLPVLVVIHSVFLVVWAILSPKRIITTLVVLALAFPFLNRTIGIPKSTTEPVPEGPRLKILNYNIGNFSIFK